MNETPEWPIPAGDTMTARWTTGSTALLCSSLMALGAAAAVFTFGVIVTTAVYGSRMAWLFGVVLPLLAGSAALARCAIRMSKRPVVPVAAVADRGPERADPGAIRRDGAARTLLVISLVLFALPFVLAACWLSVYGLLIVTYWLRH
ncbi:MAG: hypothetical protein ACLQPH_11300 [Acidimicrobiales bacterium]